MECKVKSLSKPTAKWSKDGIPLVGSNFKELFTDLGDNMYLCQLEIRVSLIFNDSAVEKNQFFRNHRHQMLVNTDAQSRMIKEKLMQIYL